MTTEAKPDFSDVVRKIADNFKESATQQEGGIIVPAKDLYEKSLPEGIDISTVRKLQDHDSQYLAGTALGFGELAYDAFAKDPTLRNVSLSVKAGVDTIKYNADRDGEFNSSWSKKGTGSAGSNYAKVRSHISGMIRKEFGTVAAE